LYLVGDEAFGAVKVADAGVRLGSAELCPGGGRIRGGVGVGEGVLVVSLGHKAIGDLHLHRRVFQAVGGKL
jgi:hypothetical protein